MNIKVFTDGGSIGNPGPSASAFVIYQDDKILAKEGKKIGHATNNVAEYTALIMALEQIKELVQAQLISPKKINIFSDSNLLVNQVNGLFKVKNSRISEFIFKIRGLEQEIGIPIVYKHVYREANQFTDSLVKKALL